MLDVAEIFIEATGMKVTIVYRRFGDIDECYEDATKVEKIKL